MNSSKNKLTIIIPNFDGRKHLEYCLPSVLKQSYSNFEIVLVDNGSTDGSVEFIQEKFPTVKVITNKRNLGFAEANNIAIRTTSGRYVVTLNNDTKADPNWLGEMVKAAEQDQNIGMIACKILYMEEPHLIDSAGLEIDQVGMAWNRYNGMTDPCETEPYEVFCSTGAAALFKREMLNEVGLFDEAFFAYCEDMDLGWRARLMGWKCVYVPTAVVYHYHSATSGQQSQFKRYLLTRNRIWTVIKNYPSPELWLHLPKLIFYDWLAMVYRMWLEKNFSPIQGRLAALSQLRQMWQKRRLIQAKRSTSEEQWRALLKPPANILQSYRANSPRH